MEDVRGILKASLEAKQTELAIAKATQQGQPQLDRLHSLAKEFNAKYGQALRLWKEIEATAMELRAMGFPNPPGEPHLVVLEWKRPTAVAVGLRPRGLVMGGGQVVRNVHEGKSIARGDVELLPLQE